MSSPQCPACSSSHWQFTSPAFLKEPRKLSGWCQIHSEKCWCSLILHALGIKLGLGCVRTSKLCYQNQFCAALFPHTPNKQSHAKENREGFWQDEVGFIYSVSSWSNRYWKHLSVPCQLHISALLHDGDLSTQIWLRQTLCSQTALIYEDVSERPTTSSCKMKKKKCLVKWQLCRVMLIYSAHCAASWNNSEAVTL